jgi:hypothetical protein
MAVVDAHPSAEKLAAFTLGTLNDGAHLSIETHVATCAICQARAAVVPGDGLLELLRSAHARTGCHAADTSAEAALAPTPVPGARADLSVTLAHCSSPSTPTEVNVPPELECHERYRVSRCLGAGGMGAVFEAEHRVMQRTVALKVINRSFMVNATAVERFRREVRAAARLSHPNIVTTYDAEDAGDTQFLVMEYVEGVNLGRLVRERGPLPVIEACAAVRQAALGLQQAHERGMVHRDVKPANLIRCSDGTVKLLDFGLAALTAERGDGLTDDNIVMGTPDYMAPEQAEDPRRADIRADVYSLGCTLYHLLTGEVPYPAATGMQKILAHREQPLPRVRHHRPEVPPKLAGVLARMLAKKPNDRYQTPGEAAAALEPFTPGAVPSRPRRALWAIAAAALFAGIVLAGGVYRIQTDRGELVITSESDDVEVVIKQRDKVVRIIDTKTDKEITLTLRSGTYELELKGAHEGLKLDIDKATLTRGKQTLAKIERVARAAAAKKDSTAMAPGKDDLRLIHRADWRTDGVLLGDVAVGGRYFLATVRHVTDQPQGVRVWDGQTGKVLWDHKHGHSAKFSPDGELVYNLETEAYRAVHVKAYRSTSGELVRNVGRRPAYAHEFYISSGGEYAMLTTGWKQAKPLSVWQLSDGAVLREFGPFRGADFTPDGRHVWITAEGEQRRVYRLPGFEEVPLAAAPFAPFALVNLQPAGKYAIAAHTGDPLESHWLIDRDGAQLHRWLPRSYKKVLSHAHWINGQESLVSLDDGTLRLFDVVTHEERTCYRLPAGEKALRIDLAPDRDFVVATTDRGAVLMFRLPDRAATRAAAQVPAATKP